jgi:exopolysaccharide biosynthesis WecB/TagA/CpsF family protein
MARELPRALPEVVVPLPGGGTHVVRITDVSRGALVRDLAACLSAGRGFAVATVNLDHMVKLRDSAAFRAAYAAQTHVVADGNPVTWLARLAGHEVELVPGSELVVPLCRLAAEAGVPVGLFGSRAEALDGAAGRLAGLAPGLEVAARIAPPFGFDPEGAEAEAMLARMGASRARLWFLALGAPKQELFAARALGRLPGAGFVSVGAGLDFLAGTQVRAPWVMRRLAAEWVWRMLQDPARLGPRYARCIAALPGLMRAARAHRGRAVRG